MKVILSLILFLSCGFIAHAQCDSTLKVLKTNSLTVDTIAPEWRGDPFQIPRSPRLCFTPAFLEIRAKVSEKNSTLQLKIISLDSSEITRTLFYTSGTEFFYINTLEDCSTGIHFIFGKEYDIELTPIDAAGNEGEMKKLRVNV